MQSIYSLDKYIHFNINKLKFNDKSLKNQMKIICFHYGKSCNVDNAKFCSQGCKNSSIVAIEKRVRKTVETDSNHTGKLSKDNPRKQREDYDRPRCL